MQTDATERPWEIGSVALRAAFQPPSERRAAGPASRHDRRDQHHREADEPATSGHGFGWSCRCE